MGSPDVSIGVDDRGEKETWVHFYPVVRYSFVERLVIKSE